MATHWADFELRLRDKLHEPTYGSIDQPRLVRWANEGLDKLPMDAQLCRARIVIRFSAGAVTLMEEDWPGTEAVGIPLYQFGKSGAFYIVFAEKIDAIHEILPRDVQSLDVCGDPIVITYWDNLQPLLYKEWQENMTGPTVTAFADSPLYYGVYRYPVYTPISKQDLRPATVPLETLAVWFDPMFDYAADACGDPVVEKYFQVQYRRRPPRINMALDVCGDPLQPYFYLQELYEDFVFWYVMKQALFSLSDNRLGVAVQEHTKVMNKIKHNMADRGDVDEPWRLQNPDAVFMRPDMLND